MSAPNGNHYHEPNDNQPCGNKNDGSDTYMAEGIPLGLSIGAGLGLLELPFLNFLFNSLGDGLIGGASFGLIFGMIIGMCFKKKPKKNPPNDN
ncbi:MAG: hypothetical protein FWC71_11755 [Defluviitaleaceae bacterium]|nr:hypothetical protein [Defluviitaleaceae bacterium]